MGNKIESNDDKQSLDDLKKDLQTMSDEDMNDVKGGGKKPPSNKWNISLGGYTPQ